MRRFTFLILDRYKAAAPQAASTALVLASLFFLGSGAMFGQENRTDTNPSGTQKKDSTSGVTGKASAGVRGANEKPESQPKGSNSQSSSQQISESQLVGLPLNGRSYNQLATLEAGVSDPSAGSSSRGGGSGSLTVVGGRATANNFLLDGTNVMDSENQVPRSAAGVQLGSDAVFEVQVLSTQYGPEYGRGSGGVLNSITRSGTPKLHGTLFEYFRNSKLDARNFFDPDPEPAPFKRNQFGATLTGPVRKDRAFFMFSYEGLRDRLTETAVNFFPDALSRQGVITSRGGDVLQTLAVRPSVRPYLALYPLPNGEYLGGGVGQNAAPQFEPTDENYLTFRVDHKLTDRDSLFVRYTFDDATSRSGETNYLWSHLSDTRQQYLTLVGSHIFNTRRLVSFRAGYTRPSENADTVDLLNIPRSLYFVSSAPHFGQITVPSLTPLGAMSSMPDYRVTNTFQYAADFIAQQGRHSMRVGFDAHRYRWYAVNHFAESATWSFNSFENFLQGGPQGTNLQVSLPGGDNGRDYRQTLLAFYFQDQYRIGPRFQLNLGLRFEHVSILKEALGEDVFLPDPIHDTALRIGPIYKNNPSGRTFAPRIGWRWAPRAGRSLVLQGGAGFYYDHLLAYSAISRKSTAPFLKVVTNPNFDSSERFPDALAGAVAPGALPYEVQVNDYANTVAPRVLRYNFSIEQTLPGQWNVQAAYVGAKGIHMLRRYEANLFPAPIALADGSLFFPDDCVERARLGLIPSPLCRPGAGPVNPAFGRMPVLASDAQSFYNSLQLAAGGRPTPQINLQVRYTYSKSVDDDSTAPGPPGNYQFGLMRTGERALSDFDIRHRVTMNYFWTPGVGAGNGKRGAGILGAALSGFRLGGIVSYRTGVPSTPQVNVRTPGYLFAPIRPNLIAGRSNNPTSGVSEGCPGIEPGRKLGTPEMYFDPCSFSVPPPGTLGNLGRNTIVAPSVFNADVSIQKDFAIDSQKRLQFRAEIFNILNHPNFGKNSGNTAIVFSGANARRNTGAGRLSQSATTARQLQFALRLSF